MRQMVKGCAHGARLHQWLLALVAVGSVAPMVIGPVAPASAAAGSAAGHLYSFGDNQFGQLGTVLNSGNTGANPSPGLVELPGTSSPVVQVAAGGSHSLALTAAGQLFAFGNNQFGELGGATNLGTTNPTSTPEPVALPGASGAVAQIAAGTDFSFAVTTTGQLYGFGDNIFGQLGTTTHNGNPSANLPTQVTLPGATGPPIEVAAGESHTLVLTSSGQLYAFGLNSHGELGSMTNNGVSTANPSPTLVTLPGATGLPVQIAAGTGFSLVLTSTGQVFAFGINNDGQLGNSTNNGSPTPNPSPRLVGLPGAIGSPIAIAAGTDHTLVLTSSGQLYAFGANAGGQLGNSTNEGGANPTPTLVTLPSGSSVVTQIAAGNRFSLALTNLGQLYAFGSNVDGELGTSTNSGTSTPTPTPTGVAFPGAATIDTIARGGEAQHSLAVVANLAVTSGALPQATVGAPYGGTPLASGGTPPYRWSATGLPAGLSIAPSGTVSGLPTTAGTSHPIFTVTDGDGIIASGPGTIVVVNPVIPPIPPPTATIAGVSVAGGNATVSIVCHGVSGQRCAGKLVGATRERRKGGKVVAVMARKRPSTKTTSVTVVRSSFGLAAGQTQTIHIALSRVGKGLLKAFYKVPVTLVMTGAGRTALIVNFAYARIRAGHIVEWSFTRAATQVTKLTLEDLPLGARVVVRCKGGGCPFAHRSLTPAKHKHTLPIAPLFKKTSLAPKSMIELDISAPDRVGQVFEFRIGSGKLPIETQLCQPPGARAPEKCA